MRCDVKKGACGGLSVLLSHGTAVKLSDFILIELSCE